MRPGLRWGRPVGVRRCRENKGRQDPSPNQDPAEAGGKEKAQDQRAGAQSSKPDRPTRPEPEAPRKTAKLRTSERFPFRPRNQSNF